MLTRNRVRRPLALALAGLATAATLAVTTQTAEAGTVIAHCYTPHNAPVYLYPGGPWMYSVGAGRVFAVESTSYYGGQAYFKGHGNGQPTGHSPARYYTYCGGA